MSCRGAARASSSVATGHCGHAGSNRSSACSSWSRRTGSCRPASSATSNSGPKASTPHRPDPHPFRGRVGKQVRPGGPASGQVSTRCSKIKDEQPTQLGGLPTCGVCYGSGYRTRNRCSPPVSVGLYSWRSPRGAPGRPARHRGWRRRPGGAGSRSGVLLRVATEIIVAPRPLCVHPPSLLRDSWNRLITATARALGVPLVTKDGRITAVGLVQVIWCAGVFPCCEHLG